MIDIEKLEITGVLLVGGESRRMGRNKALLEAGGRTLIERNLDVLSGTCEEVLISSRDPNLYTGYGYKVVEDIIKGKGPLGGIYSVLQEAKYDNLFLAACDMPFLNQKAIACLYKELGDYEAVVPCISGKIHPLHAFYHRSILPLVKKNIQESKLKLTELLELSRTKIVYPDESLKDHPDRRILEQSFWNVNTPEEWKSIIKNMDKFE